MAYDPLTTAETDGNSPVTTTLWTKVKNNFDFLKGLFHGTTGHKHTGAADDGPLIASVADLAITSPKLVFLLGDTLAMANVTEKSTTSISNVKLKESSIDRGGSIRVKWTIRSIANGGWVYGTLYKNGVAVGSEVGMQSVTPSIQTQDLTGLNPNDLIQVYGRTINGGQTCYIKDLEFYVNPLGATGTAIL